MSTIQDEAELEAALEECWSILPTGGHVVDELIAERRARARIEDGDVTYGEVS